MATPAQISAAHVVETAFIIPPASATKIASCETPEWDAALAAHRDQLLAAGITTWTQPRKSTTRPRRPRKKPAPASSTT